jgi:hypothetical protein
MNVLTIVIGTAAAKNEQTTRAICSFGSSLPPNDSFASIAALLPQINKDQVVATDSSCEVESSRL